MKKQEYIDKLISLYSISNSGFYGEDHTEDKISALWKKVREDLTIFEFMEVWETVAKVKTYMGWS